MEHTEKERYIQACSYPGRLDVHAVEHALAEYCAALGIRRTICRIGPGWTLDALPDLAQNVDDIIQATRASRDAQDASAARAAREAGAVLAARDTQEASAARDAQNALDVRDVLDARDAQDALAARDTSVAQDVLAARDTQEASAARAALITRAAQDARAAREARVARDARLTRDMRDALITRDTREARDAREARRQFAQWCIQSGGWWFYRWELSWLAIHDIGATQLRLPEVRRWARPLMEAFCAGGWYLYWTETTLYWVAKPTLHYRTGTRQLHCATGPAVEADVEPLWFWNGVLVTEQIVLAPHTLTAQDLAKEENAQIRQVMVERIGIERVCAMFQAVVMDRQGDYELLRLDLGDGRVRPYLKMLNPSVAGMWHVEGVHPDCETVQHAINWRAGDIHQPWTPEVLT